MKIIFKEKTLSNELELPDLINKETGLDERETYFLDVLFDEANGDISYAMKLAGYPVNTSANEVRKKLSKEIREATKNYLVSQTPAAAVNLSRILREPNLPGNQNIIKAAKEILDRGDVVQDQSKAEELPRNIIVLLPPKRQPIIEDIEYEEL